MADAPGAPCMKKLKHEAELFKAALLAGVKYAEGRGAVEFEPTDSPAPPPSAYLTPASNAALNNSDRKSTRLNSSHSQISHARFCLKKKQNPYDDNGIKLFVPDGFKLSDEIEHKIEELVDSELVKMLAKSADVVRAMRIADGQGRYLEFAKRTLPRNLSLEGLRVVVDCANGAAYKVAPQALWELGAEAISLGVEPDGFNINRECGSTEPAALCPKVN